MKNDDFALNAELENLLGAQIRKILATQTTEPLQATLNRLVKSLDINPLELAAALLFLDASTLSACVNANADALQNATAENLSKTGHNPISDPLLQQLSSIFKPSELKPEKLKMVRYRLEVGRKHQVSIEDIKDVLISESGVERAKIGHLDMRNHYTLIDLPNGMPPDIFQHLQSVEIKQHTLQIKRVTSSRKRQWQRRKGAGKSHPKEPEPHSIENKITL